MQFDQAYLSLRYDLRAPAFGPPAAELYRTALDQCAWAEEHGFASVAVSEHHGADDGYCPSPLVLAAAIAGRTSSLRITIAALVAPLHHPLRLAEDLAVLDLVSGGRVDVILGAGYREAECAMFGVAMEDRGRLLEETVGILRAAWAGDEIDHGGRGGIRVTPSPIDRGPLLLLGGSTPAGARRAARIADGFVPVDAALWPAYVAACAEVGRDPLGMPPPPGPGFIHVATDPDAAWERIAPHALHETNSYGAWLAESGGIAVYRPCEDAETLRADGRYVVMTPAECLDHVRGTGSLRLQPLMGGLPPDLSWDCLHLVASEVLPRLRETATTPTDKGARP